MSNPEAGKSTPKILSYAARRRATKACIACRTRKVRCDVTVKGTPCTNCQLDSKCCVVKDRASRRRLPRKEDMEHVFDSVYPPASVPEGPESAPDPVILLQSADGVAKPRGTSSIGSEACFRSSDKSPENTGPSPESDGDFDLTQHLDYLANSPPVGRHDSSKRRGSMHSTLTPTKPIVRYSHYPFISLNNFPILSGQDIAFLDIKGCLDIPERSILDEFMRQYFLHVHPFLPLIDEGEFWSIYNQEQEDSNAQVSLLLFQAMLFASCSFVPEVITKNLGFSQIRLARRAFYQKAKLLYDFSTESSPKIIAQAALLMTMAAPPEMQPIQPNTMWLKIALHHARCVNAHLAWEPTPEATISHSQHQLSMLKRLWWCCLIRDRFLSLGLKRSIQVSKSYPVLTLRDFQSDINLSEVHNPATKQRLICLFLRITELCNILTNVLLLIWPLDSDLALSRPEAPSLSDCRNALCRWHKKTQTDVDLINRGSGIRQHSVIVHTNLMYMVYFAARAAIPHHEVLLSCYDSRESSAKSTSNEKHGKEVQDAIVGTTECLNELLQLDLARYLPLSAMAFTIIPLLLNVLDAKLLSHTETSSDVAIKQRRLHVLLEAMKEYHPHYEGVEWIGYAVRHVVNLAQIDSSFLLGKLVSNWTDLLIHYPSYYLRLTLTIELSLSRSKIPDEHDVPERLRAILSPKSGHSTSIDDGIEYNSRSSNESTYFELINDSIGNPSTAQGHEETNTSEEFNFDKTASIKSHCPGKETDMTFDDLISASLDAEIEGIQTMPEATELGSHSPNATLDALCDIGLVGVENDLDCLINGHMPDR